MSVTGCHVKCVILRIKKSSYHLNSVKVVKKFINKLLDFVYLQADVMENTLLIREIEPEDAEDIVFMTARVSSHEDFLSLN